MCWHSLLSSIILTYLHGVDISSQVFSGPFKSIFNTGFILFSCQFMELKQPQERLLPVTFKSSFKMELFQNEKVNFFIAAVVVFAWNQSAGPGDFYIRVLKGLTLMLLKALLLLFVRSWNRGKFQNAEKKKKQPCAGDWAGHLVESDKDLVCRLSILNS